MSRLETMTPNSRLPEYVPEPWDVAIIDPPWPQKQSGKRQVRKHQSGDFNYTTMSLGEIWGVLDTCIFPRGGVSSTVFLWAIDKFLVTADEQMTARGFKRHARIIWDKGNGIAPAFTLRFSHEYLVWYYRPSLVPIDQTERGKMTTVIQASGREHSRKPDQAYQMVARLYPTARRLDVFSRESRVGWAQWGDEIDYYKTGKVLENE